MKSRILVCGGRNYWDRAAFDAAMECAQKWFAQRFCIIEGDATGADTLAKEWARKRGVPVITMCANWTIFGDQAGSLRNIWMQEFAMPDLVIAFPGGIGTASMVDIATENGVDVWKL